MKSALIHYPDGTVQNVLRLLAKTFGSSQAAALVGIGAFAVYGSASRRNPAAVGRPGRGVLQRPVPRPVLIALGFGAVLATGVGAAYAYYAPPGVLLDEMRQVNAELGVAARRGDRGAALASLERFDALATKLSPSTLLRHGLPTAEATTGIAELKQALAEMRRALADSTTPVAWEQALRCHNALRVCARAYEAKPRRTAETSPSAHATSARGGQL